MSSAVTSSGALLGSVPENTRFLQQDSHVLSLKIPQSLQVRVPYPLKRRRDAEWGVGEGGGGHSLGPHARLQHVVK